VKQIQQKHLSTFSFNNIAVLLDKSISTDIDDIIEKIVTKNLGGYCFEHNKLIYEVLKSLGFNVQVSIARVINKQNTITPKTHRITILNFEEEKYIIDAGFGAYTPTTPLKIEDTKDSQNNFRIVQENNDKFCLEFRTHNDFFTLYQFYLLEYTEKDCDKANLYSYSNPKAVFLNNFIISKKMKTLTLSYRNNSYHLLSCNNTEIIDIKDSLELSQMIQNDFDIILSESEAKTLFKKAEFFKTQ